MYCCPMGISCDSICVTHSGLEIEVQRPGSTKACRSAGEIGVTAWLHAPKTVTNHINLTGNLSFEDPPSRHPSTEHEAAGWSEAKSRKE